MEAELLRTLEQGPEYRFRDWPNAEIPQVAAGVYTIWNRAELIYVGMAGRSLTADTVAVHRAAEARGKGLFSRLGSHASGRRSGDQFCVYVADRLVLATLSRTQIDDITRGEHSMDALIRIYIHETLSYRFVEVLNGSEARKLERDIRLGALSAGPPLLNPGRVKTGSGKRTA